MKPAVVIGIGLAAAGAAYAAWRLLLPSEKPVCSLSRKILYGVVGEGMGHAIRSGVIIEHLAERGHEVEIIASSRAADYLAKRFSGVRRIHGLHMVYEDGKMLLGETLVSNVLRGLAKLPENIAAYFALVDSFKPDVVISDFESWTHLYAKLHGLPILSLDNMQVINRCTIPAEIVSGHEVDFQLARAFVKSKLPLCDRYVITTFFRPPVCEENVTLVPPILRPEILAAKTRRGGHLLVYQTSEGDGMADALRGTDIECRVYGARRGLQADDVDGNLRHRPFSETGFIDDLASCRGVIASGGFTLMGEAIFLRKPMLAVPVGGQFEQLLNARYLEAMGYGMTSEKLGAEAMKRFLTAIPTCEAKLAGYRQDGNIEAFAAVDAWLAQAGCR